MIWYNVWLYLNCMDLKWFSGRARSFWLGLKYYHELHPETSIGINSTNHLPIELAQISQILVLFSDFSQTRDSH